jgi:serine/threonine protein kinase
MGPDEPDDPTADGGGARTRASLSAIDVVIRFAPGDTIAGRYKITRMIAHGGMGDVYEATDQDLRSEIALKTIRGAATGGRVASVQSGSTQEMIPLQNCSKKRSFRKRLQ